MPCDTTLSKGARSSAKATASDLSQGVFLLVLFFFKKKRIETFCRDKKTKKLFF